MEMESVPELDQEMKEALDKTLETLIALVRVSYAKGRMDATKELLERRIIQMAQVFASTTKSH